jgi:putative DNA primase/helicase
LDKTLDEIKSMLSTCVVMDKNKGEVKFVDRSCCVHTLLDNLHIRTSVKADKKKDILIYRNGCYQPDGDLTIEKLLSYAFLDIKDITGRSIFNTHEKNEILARIKELTPTGDNHFDKDLNIINMDNCLYDWNEGQALSHSHEYPSRIQIPVKYDPSATCPTIEEFLRTVLEREDIPKIIEFAGYCLYRSYPIQKSIILLGPGGTGKSQLIDILRAFVGEDNAFGISPQDITKDRFAAADLYRKLLDAVPDVGSEKLVQTAAIKALTGHTDRIKAQRKYQDPFEFVNFAKMIFGFNAIPESADKTSGWYRRIEIIRMEHILGGTEFSKEFLKRLTSPEELSGLFNLAIKALPDLLKRNAFTNETSREDTAEEYEAASSPMEYFCDRFLKNIPGEMVTKAVLFEKFKEFCVKAGAPILTSNKLGMYIHNEVEWMIGRQKKEEVRSINNKSEAVWPDTFFDEAAFQEWIIS